MTEQWLKPLLSWYNRDVDENSLRYLIEMAANERSIGGWDGGDPLPGRLMALARALAEEQGWPVERLVALCLRELHRRDAREKTFLHRFGPAYHLRGSFEPPCN